MTFELLKKLAETNGPSGNEAGVREIIKKEIKPFVDNIYTDNIGNLICHKKGKGEKVMLAAHMDEIGLMIRDIEEDGKIRLSSIGGIAPISLIGQRVDIETSKKKQICSGVITFEELHNDYEIGEKPALEDLYVDTGLSEKELKKIHVEVGNFIVPDHTFRSLGSPKIISGKGLDDRVGCYILIQLAKKLKKVRQDLYYVFTVQEEIGLYGAQVSTYNLEPDWGIAVDVMNAEDGGDEKHVIMGKGPVLVLKDESMITDKCLDDWLRKIAHKLKINLQLKVDDVGSTDASRIMVSKGGLPSTVLSVAVRNLHSTISIAHLGDVEQAIKILYELLKNPPRVCVIK